MYHENKLLKNIQNEINDEKFLLVQNQLEDEKFRNANLQNRLNDIQIKKFELECQMNIMQKNELEFKENNSKINDSVIKSKEDQIIELKGKLNQLKSILEKKSEDNELSIKKLEKQVEDLSKILFINSNLK